MKYRRGVERIEWPERQMVLATRIVHIHRVFLDSTFQNERVLIVDIKEIYSSKSSALSPAPASKTAAMNTYYWSNQRKFANEFSYSKGC